jgi:hypothetical protein
MAGNKVAQRWDRRVRANDAKIRCFDRKVRHNRQVWPEKILEITDLDVRDMLA